MTESGHDASAGHPSRRLHIVANALLILSVVWFALHALGLTVILLATPPDFGTLLTGTRFLVGVALMLGVPWGMLLCSVLIRRQLPTGDSPGAVEPAD